MMLKNFIRIVTSYKFNLVPIIYYEFFYLLKGYRGNKFNFSNNDLMADDIPSPYYFLVKIKKILKNKNFYKFLDLGCGSGRVIDFFSKNFSDKNFIGIEYFSQQYNYCKNVFKNKNNIEIFQADFTKSDFFQYSADCYFFNNPFKKESELINFIEKTTNYSFQNKNVLFIFVNFNKNIIENFKNIECIDSFYISEIKGYSICKLKND